jgi:hypothetical protein
VKIAEVVVGLPIVFSWWIPLLLVALGFVGRAIYAGLNAEEVVRKRCHDEVVRIRDVLTTTDVWPALSRVMAQVFPHLPRPPRFGGSAASIGDGEVLRVVKVRYAELAPALNELEERTTRLIRAALMHDRLVKLVKSCGVASVLVLFGAVYCGFRLVTPTLIPGAFLTIPLDALAALVLGAGIGAMVVLWFSQLALYRQVSIEVRSLRPPPGGSTA